MWIKRGNYRKIKKRKHKVPGTSKAELLFGLWLKKIGIEVETQFAISYKFFDFKIKNKKVLIEFHGSYWHGSEELYKPEQLNEVQKNNTLNDVYKKYLADKYGYKLIVVWEHHFNNNPSKVKKEILSQLKNI